MRHRRFPYLERADLAVLDALDPRRARVFDLLLQEQERSERRFRALAITESGLKPGAVERARVRARYGDGAGGGRKRRIHAAPDA
jgi:hypothetical protein